MLFLDDPSVASSSRNRPRASTLRHDCISAHADQRRSRGCLTRREGCAGCDRSGACPAFWASTSKCPFLNAARKGVHDETKLRWLNEDALGLLTSLRGGKDAGDALHPSARHRRSSASSRMQGVIVLRRSQNGTYAEIRTALDHGLTGFTHLFNAMLANSPGASRGWSAQRWMMTAAGAESIADGHRRRSGRAEDRDAQQAPGSFHAGDRRRSHRRCAQQNVQPARPANLGGLRQYAGGRDRPPRPAPTSTWRRRSAIPWKCSTWI